MRFAIILCGPIPVYGTKGTLKLANDMCESIEESFLCEIIEDGDSRFIGDQCWHWSRTQHYVETLACRVDVEDSSFVFTADTGPEWDAKSLGDRVDLMIAESTFLSERENEEILHLSARQAGLLASNARAEKLVLSHLAPGESESAHLEEAQSVFSGPISLASVGKHYEV